MAKEDVVLYHDRDKVRVGGFHRYTIALDSAAVGTTLYVRVRNTELSALRAAYLTGPFTLYVDMTPQQYDESAKTREGAEPRYENHLKAGSHFSAELKVLESRQVWTVDVVSEILFSRSASVGYEVLIGTTKAASKLHGSTTIERHMSPSGLNGAFHVRKQDTVSLWQLPIPRPNEPLHVCVLTHGLVSNVTADMFYVKELLDKAASKTGENMVVKGYTGNVCRTERGVKYLGRRVADWIVNELIPTYQPAKLSFVSHSLGGLIQTYALGYIEATHPDVLRNVELVNFVALASPFLGISHENPGYVRFALDFGVVGKTGRDLGLSWLPTQRPLLEELPNEHTRRILRRFTHRTIYANSVNDGIVPLRTASLLYLDWRALGLSNDSEHPSQAFPKSNENSTHPHLLRHHHDQNKGAREHGDSRLLRRHSEQQAFYTTEKQTDGDSESSHGTVPIPDRPPMSPTGSTTSASSSGSPFSSFLFGDSRRLKKLARYQTVNTEVPESLNEVGELLPHKTSLIESGMSLLLPPHPNRNFITDPDCRDNVVFHDRVYYSSDLPERRFKDKLSLSKGRKEKVEVARNEERIARDYHEGMAWRKVLVQLLPEAHNNIIVRRRFSNAYGWPVVRHLVEQHFITPGVSDKADSESEALSNTGGENLLWEQSEEENEAVTEQDHDPQRLSMLKIIPT